MFQFLIHHTPLLYLTQSFWRDEVYSVFISARPISFFVQHLSFEPPFYYLLLHFWMKLFGQSEVAVRSLSLLGLTFAAIVVIFWSEKLFRKHWLSWWLPVCFFFNPTLLYYGMEARTYGWYIFFATLSFWAYAQNRWIIWTIATVLGFYTHSFLLIVPAAQLIHYLLTHRARLLQSRTNLFRDPLIRALGVVALCIAPWSLRLLQESAKLRQSWYYPVDMQLVYSVLGNLFVGYEGTPWYLWRFTKILSLGILVLTFIALRNKEAAKTARMFAIQIYAPLILIIGISFFKPLYVNRYVIPVTIAEVFLTAMAIAAIRKPVVQKMVGAVILLFILGWNIWYPDKHAKFDIRAVMTQVNSLQGKNDVILADSPLIFFETMYYSKDKTKVYLYNPQNSPFPWYVGDAIVSPSQMVADYPPYPMRGFLVHTDGTFEVVFQTPISAAIRKPL